MGSTSGKLQRVCDFINAHEDLIKIASLGEYRVVMKITRVIREAYLVERKRLQSKREKRFDEKRNRTKKAKRLIGEIRLAAVREDENKKSLEKIGDGSS